MNADDNNGGFEVGYAKPPANKRFKKGHSGNPKGRPKGMQSFGSVFRRTLNEPVVIVRDGKRKTITKREALVQQITNQAVMGDQKAAKLILDHDRDASEKAEVQARIDRTNALSETNVEKAGYFFVKPRTREELERRIAELLAKAGQRLVPIDPPEEELG